MKDIVSKFSSVAQISQRLFSLQTNDLHEILSHLFSICLQLWVIICKWRRGTEWKSLGKDTQAIGKYKTNILLFPLVAVNCEYTVPAVFNMNAILSCLQVLRRCFVNFCCTWFEYEQKDMRLRVCLVYIFSGFFYMFMDGPVQEIDLFVFSWATWWEND